MTQIYELIKVFGDSALDLDLRLQAFDAYRGAHDNLSLHPKGSLLCRSTECISDMVRGIQSKANFDRRLWNSISEKALQYFKSTRNLNGAQLKQVATNLEELNLGNTIASGEEVIEGNLPEVGLVGGGVVAGGLSGTLEIAVLVATTYLAFTAGLALDNAYKAKTEGIRQVEEKIALELLGKIAQKLRHPGTTNFLENSTGYLTSVKGRLLNGVNFYDFPSSQGVSK
jgi:hypothetical protein